MTEEETAAAAAASNAAKSQMDQISAHFQSVLDAGSNASASASTGASTGAPSASRPRPPPWTPAGPGNSAAAAKPAKGPADEDEYARLKREEAAAKLERAWLHLKSLPKSTRQATPLLYFLHIHKAGGTSFCQTAHANNELASEAHNCNVDKTSNGAVQAAMRMNLDLDDQRKLLVRLKERFSFVANEGKLPMQLYAAPDLVRYVVLVRHPIALTLSQEHFGRKVGVIPPDVSYAKYTQLQVGRRIQRTGSGVATAAAAAAAAAHFQFQFRCQETKCLPHPCSVNR